MSADHSSDVCSACPSAEVPPQWQAVAAELREASFPGHVGGYPLRLDVWPRPPAPTRYLRLSVVCPLHEHCVRYRSCLLGGGHGQRGVAAHLGAWARAAARASAEGRRHDDYQPTPAEVDALASELGWW